MLLLSLRVSASVSRVLDASRAHPSIGKAWSRSISSNDMTSLPTRGRYRVAGEREKRSNLWARTSKYWNRLPQK